jgi:pimeloyl-ACP methyl ester carboxylesterase
MTGVSMSQNARRWSRRRAQLSATAVRTGVATLEAVAPRAAGALVEWLWFRPPRPSAAALRRHAALLADAEPFTLSLHGRALRGWTLGDGPAVLLVHGWGGWSAQLAPIARALADNGLSATAVDFPGHGSDTARRSDLFQMIDTLRLVVERRGAPTLVVAHSLGALAAALAFDDAPPQAAVFLAPALATTPALDVFAQMLQLRPATARDLRTRLERFAVDLWPRMNPGVDLRWPGGPLLIVHDRDDPQTPFDLSAALAQRRDDVELLEVSGPGHNRLLRDPDVVGEVAYFATDHVATRHP